MIWVMIPVVALLAVQSNEITTVADFLRSADSFVFASLFFVAMWRRWIRWGADYLDLLAERDMYRDKVLEQAAENARTIQALADTMRMKT